jgi:hypothetical protein
MYTALCETVFQIVGTVVLCTTEPLYRSRYSYWGMGWTTPIQIPVGISNFSVTQNVKTGCGAHPVSHTVRPYWSSFPWVKAAGS